MFAAAVDYDRFDLERGFGQREEISELPPVARGAVVGAALDCGDGDFLWEEGQAKFGKGVR